MNWSLNIKLVIFILNLFYIFKTSIINSFKLNLFDASTGAKCLDGSPYGVYYSAGFEAGQKNILINFWGGGWCNGRDTDSFIATCYERAKTRLGSSNTWEDEMIYESGFLSNDEKKNPNFFNWHRFDFPYCDGSAHQGFILEPVKFNSTNLYFRGHFNVIAGLEYIKNIINIPDLEKVVITGCSAGGYATFYWSNYISDYLSKLNKKLKFYGIPDSGFFINYQNLITNDHDFLLRLNILYKLVNKERPHIITECLLDNVDEEFKCLLPEKMIMYIKSAFLIIQPGYDTWQLLYIRGQLCSENNTLSKCSGQEIVRAHEFKNHQNKLIMDEIKRKENLSIWVPSCLTHCFENDIIYSENWQVPEGSGNTINLTINNFIKTEGQQKILIDDFDWPYNSKCSSSRIIEPFKNSEDL